MGTIRLGQALRELSEVDDDRSVEETAARVVSRATGSGRRRTLWTLLSVVLALALLVGGIAGWTWWRERPLPDPFGEPEPTVQYAFPDLPSDDLVKKRCPGAYIDNVVSWGSRIATTDGTECSVGWEAPATTGASLGERELSVAELRTTCQQLSGKDLSGWRLMARSKAGGSIEDIRIQEGLYRAANGFVAACSVYWDDTGTRALVEVLPLASASVQSFLGASEDGKSVRVGTRAAGAVTDETTGAPDPRAALLRIDLGPGLPACELPVTNGFVQGWCSEKVPVGDDVPQSGAGRPIVGHVLDRHGRELRHIDAVMS